VAMSCQGTGGMRFIIVAARSGPMFSSNQRIRSRRAASLTSMVDLRDVVCKGVRIAPMEGPWPMPEILRRACDGRAGGGVGMMGP
jgi:hypothetical protein